MSAIGPVSSQILLPTPPVSANSASKVDRDGDGDHNAPDISRSVSPKTSGLLNALA
jgi:hypothetical protein